MPPNALNGTASRTEPWQQPCDRHLQLSVGAHHACTINEKQQIQCDGHNAAGQSAAGRAPLSTEEEDGDRADDRDDDGKRVGAADADVYVKVDGHGHVKPSSDLDDGHAYVSLCAGEEHTCALRLNNQTESVAARTVHCWGKNYSSTIDTTRLNVQVVMPLPSLILPTRRSLPSDAPSLHVLPTLIDSAPCL